MLSGKGISRKNENKERRLIVKTVDEAVEAVVNLADKDEKMAVSFFLDGRGFGFISLQFGNWAGV